MSKENEPNVQTVQDQSDQNSSSSCTSIDKKDIITEDISPSHISLGNVPTEMSSQKLKGGKGDLKAVIITGGNSGLGFKCARNIGRSSEFRVIIACRSKERAEKAVQDLIRETGNVNISYLLLNLASLDSIRAFERTVIEADLSPLFGLVCNAAVSSSDNGMSRTEDGFESNFGVNHLGHFLLTNLLLPHMADNGRIVFVASDMHSPPKMMGTVTYTNARDWAYPEKYVRILHYCRSKLCNIYTVYELARRLETSGNTHVTVNAFNPGMMPDTGLMGDKTGLVLGFIKKVMAPTIAWMGGRMGNSEKSSQALADMITGHKYEGISGRYIDRGAEVRSSALSYSMENALELWEASEKMVGGGSA